MTKAMFLVPQTSEPRENEPATAMNVLNHVVEKL